LQGTFEIVATPEMGLQLPRKAREGDDAGPNDACRAQAALVAADLDPPGQVGIHGLGTPFPPVIVIPVDTLPGLVASGQQALEDLGLEPVMEPGAAGAVIRPAKIETGVDQVGHEVMIIATDDDGVQQAMVLGVEILGDLIATLQSARAAATSPPAGGKVN